MPNSNSKRKADVREEQVNSLRDRDSKVLGSLIGALGALISEFEWNYPSHIDSEVDDCMEDILEKSVKVQETLTLKRKLLGLREQPPLLPQEDDG